MTRCAACGPRARLGSKAPALLALALFVLLSVLGGTASAEPGLPEVLRGASASVVQVTCDDAVGSGFLLASPRQIVTALSVVNRRCEPRVRFASGPLLEARVVAWSEADGLALLELGAPSAAPPLELEGSEPVVGSAVVCLGYGKNPGQASSDPEPESAATPRFGTVSKTDAAHLGIDVRSTEADLGAPILSPAGRVIGVASGVRPDWPVLSVARASRVSALLAGVGRQGRFQPHPPAELAAFGGLFLAVEESHGLLGAGIASGFRRNWLAISVAEGFLRKDFAPIAANVFEARRRYFFELYATLDWHVSQSSKLDFGPGLALDFDAIETRRVVAVDALQTSKSIRFHPRPLFVLEWATSHVFLRMPVSVIEPALRFDIGIVLNR